jgi:hypothetical protein
MNPDISTDPEQERTEADLYASLKVKFEDALAMLNSPAGKVNPEMRDGIAELLAKLKSTEKLNERRTGESAELKAKVQGMWKEWANYSDNSQKLAPEQKRRLEEIVFDLWSGLKAANIGMKIFDVHADYTPYVLCKDLNVDLMEDSKKAAENLPEELKNIVPRTIAEGAAVAVCEIVSVPGIPEKKIIHTHLWSRARDKDARPALGSEISAVVDANNPALLALESGRLNPNDFTQGLIYTGLLLGDKSPHYRNIPALKKNTLAYNGLSSNTLVVDLNNLTTIEFSDNSQMTGKATNYSNPADFKSALLQGAFYKDASKGRKTISHYDQDMKNFNHKDQQERQLGAFTNF